MRFEFADSVYPEIMQIANVKKCPAVTLHYTLTDCAIGSSVRFMYNFGSHLSTIWYLFAI